MFINDTVYKHHGEHMTEIDLKIRYLKGSTELGVWEWVCPLCKNRGRALFKQELVNLQCGKCSGTFNKGSKGHTSPDLTDLNLRLTLLMEG